MFWGIDLGKPFIGVMKPFDGKAAACGNGTMVAMPVSSREQVDQMYQLALRLGSTCEGAPGERMPGFYAAYFRTPQGYKMNFFKMG
ncbi:hypothetical protein NQT62_06975 [Limnobacter humi]|uniref:Uncharacterized protein n=1 Tax=Limnobacter humi TaxID=1778671 RepID=A0ABT1WFD5_9BURK|nr:hypothetical protein [Limnobacter humi]MCQ8896180.1 hypothetical protein [Limnobacter humi]